LRLRSGSSLTTIAATFLFGSLAPAQQSEAFLIGHGTYQSSTQDTAYFDYVAKQHGDGSADGVAVWRVAGTIMLIRLTSSTLINGAMALAGPFVAVLGTPPPPQFGIEVGGTAFFAVQDNGPGSADRTTGISAAPAAFGPLTIQQIIALGGGGGPPPEAFRPLLSGNIRIF
jgi:hypothetical protein